MCHLTYLNQESKRHTDPPLFNDTLTLDPEVSSIKPSIQQSSLHGTQQDLFGSYGLAAFFALCSAERKRNGAGSGSGSPPPKTIRVPGIVSYP